LDASDIAASAALTNLWDSLVRHVVGEDVIPVLLVMNWDRLHSVISKSLSSTAYEHYYDWAKAKWVCDIDLQPEFMRKQGKVW
jgi:hypothetical protein